MTKYILITALIISIVFVGFGIYQIALSEPSDTDSVVIERPVDQINYNNQEEPTDPTEDTPLNMNNPASAYCVENGGVSKIITEPDGSQFGICVFDDYECEEWTYFRNECDLDGDAEKIKTALINKGLNLDDMKVVIKKHLGKYIAGGVVPVSVPAGGGYVFAVKDGGEVIVLADGNGVITCDSFSEYPDFPSYLVSECVDSDTGEIIKR